MDLGLLRPEFVRPITRAEYQQMGAVGLFQDERIELMHGVLVRMSPIGPRHNELVMRLNEVLFPALKGRARISLQGPFAAADDSQPVPDVLVLPLRDYTEEHPSEALLAIEVADSSLRHDRTIKQDLYAAVGIPEYWIVNLVDDVVEVHTDPMNGRYGTVQTHGPNKTLTPVAFPDIEVSVSDLLG